MKKFTNLKEAFQAIIDEHEEAWEGIDNLDTVKDKILDGNNQEDILEFGYEWGQYEMAKQFINMVK